MRFFYSFLMALAVLCAVESQAQTVGSSSNITGTNFYPIQVSAGIYQTNQPYQAGAFKTITLGNITTTNETVILYYAVPLTNGLVLVPGTTNLYIINSFTNSFATGTNGGSWSTTFNGTGVTMSCPASLGIAISGTNAAGQQLTNTAYVP